MTPTSQNSDPPINGHGPAAALDPEHDPYAALRVGDFCRFLLGNVVSVVGVQMQSVAVGWELWKRTHSPMALGWVGFVQIVPVLLLALPAGHTADRVSRKYILMGCMGVMATVSTALALMSATQGPLWAIYTCLGLVGVARAFQQPAKAAFVPLVVPRNRFTNAVTWSTGGFHLASIVGPALGGILIHLTERPAYVYLLDALMAGFFFTMLSSIKTPRQEKTSSELNLRELGVGIKFVYQTKIMFAALALDMFAVLLGGATALLPIYADILQVGPKGFGLMRAMPAIGALLMAFAIAHAPPMKKAGRALFWSVVGFGLATILFGVSRSFTVSLVALFLIGALDNISVVIRHTLVQLLTPDEMRGRVSAVNSMFIGASNELGGFESGLLANITSPTFSVVFGGFGTLVVVGLTMLVYPQLLRYGRLGSPSIDGPDDSDLNLRLPEPAAVGAEPSAPAALPR